jgi:ribosome-binding factor A
MSQRTQRIGDQIRAELAELLLRELRDPRVKLATISRVEVSPDLSHAVVHVSVLGDESQRTAAVAGLEHARGFLRRELAHRLSLRTTPDLRFLLDRGAEHSQRIDELLAGLDRSDRHGS